MSDKNFVFPSGLTSKRARALAKEAKKLNGTQLSYELDLISEKECQLPWHKAVAKFNNENNSTLQTKVEGIMNKYPLLGYGGFYSPLIFVDRYYQRQHRMTKNEYEKHFLSGRILSDEWLKQIKHAQKFMSLFDKNKNINHNMLGSYGLKHVCEDYCGEILGHHTYISNGALIIGAILNNFNFEQYSEHHINCSFNICKKGEFYQWYRMWKYGYRPSQHLKFKMLDKKFRPNN
ncbi:hypothetical protein BA71_00024 [Acinetobacter baumannii LAC-4]|uniref:hypothetical protein n=1 Tax=Acinetobacter baumannii TaxID=470 RepID=UPI00044E51D8|nr:hypothetical protein [Acinetobacter baumannii]AIY38216.1 hypothetical protein ABLAC_28610 [Acinetobacter baumannii LAC-4]EZF21160.1 hypothetical protein BA71_00024 [Acinetobacter baumannii LAC-4]